MRHARRLRSQIAEKGLISIASRAVQTQCAWRLCVILLLASCNEPRQADLVAAHTAEGRATLRELLTPKAAEAVGRDGKFGALAHVSASARPEISDVRARQLATLFARDLAPLIGDGLNADHGAIIAYANLRSCGPAYYAATPFAPLPAEIPAAYHRKFGPWWLISFCAPSGEAQLSVAVSAYATELDVVNDHLRFPAVSGNEFVPMGIPRQLGALPIAPERAVEISVAASGRRVDGVPSLIAAAGHFPQMAQWRLPLEAPANLRIKHAAYTGSTSVLYVGVRLFREPPLVLMPSPQQPTSFDFRWAAPPLIGGKGSSMPPVLNTGRAVLRPGFVAALDTVETTSTGSNHP
jgi:hypothetical protein